MNRFGIFHRSITFYRPFLHQALYCYRLVIPEHYWKHCFLLLRCWKHHLNCNDSKRSSGCAYGDLIEPLSPFSQPPGMAPLGVPSRPQSARSAMSRPQSARRVEMVPGWLRCFLFTSGFGESLQLVGLLSLFCLEGLEDLGIPFSQK